MAFEISFIAHHGAPLTAEPNGMLVANRPFGQVSIV